MLGALTLVLLCLTIQYGTNALGFIFMKNIEFQSTSDRTISASLSKLPNGYYYITLGRVLDKTDIFLDSHLLTSSNGITNEPTSLSLGSSFEISDTVHPKEIIIKWAASEPWRKKLFNPPMIISRRLGLLLHLARIFVDHLLGPIFSLVLLLSVLINSKILGIFDKKIQSMIFLSGVYFAYSCFLAGFSDLFYFGTLNAVAQMLLRCTLSSALVYLYGVHSRQQPLILWSHLIFGLATIVTAFLNPFDLLIIYKISIIFYCIFSVIMVFQLIRSNERQDLEVTNMLIQLGVAWSLLQGVTSIAYIVSGPSFLTMLTPGFISTMAITNIYVFYKIATNSLLEREMIKFDLLASRKFMAIASQVAHDIRSPISALSIIVANEPGISETGRDVSLSSLERMKSVSNELLDEFRLSKKIASINIDYKTFVTAIDVQEVAFKSFEEKKIEFQKYKNLKFLFRDEPDHSACTGLADRVALQRIISNLLNNAIEGSDFRGDIEFRVSTTASNVVLEIRDWGKGISPEILRCLRSGNPASTKSDGHGLGISFASTCIHSWGGKILIDSTIQKGTAISLILKRSNTNI